MMLESLIATAAQPAPAGANFLLQIAEFALMIGIDLMFIAVLILVMLPLGMYRSAAFAVMKRNFVGYFSNPTGYVFLCLFVLLTAFAAFWPHEFFTANLANFDQLNKFLPYIMLVFIPAITMSIWAEERRAGTDELLLTFPARDYDIVIGKYFAAVLVFTVSLLFSQLSNYAVLIAMTGGDLDTGLLFSTYLGYWFIGIAMLAIGMVASFLTNNLTIGFIFGAVFNAPLAFFSNADVIVSNAKLINVLFDWSLLQRFEPFGRGLIALPSIIYFLGIVLLGVYLSLVLIGRRHWMGGRDGSSLLGHFVIRIGLLLVTVVAGVLIAQYSPLNRARLDVSRERVSTLSSETVEKLRELTDVADGKQIVIDAYISDNVPSSYVRTKYELINLLREFDAIGGSNIKVNLHTGISPVGKEAIRAEQRFGIRPVPVATTSRGLQRNENVILGAAFTKGQNRMVIPFFDYGLPVEYELIRSINSLNVEEQKTIGVVMTDALPFGYALPVRSRYIQIPPIYFVIDDLRKQYNVEIVQAQSEIPLYLESSATEGDAVLDQSSRRRKYDALVVFQPSKMSPAELKNLVTAIEKGQPTLIFEDPQPSDFVFTLETERAPQPYIPPTGQDRLPFRRSNASANNQSADLNLLYNALGINTSGQNVRVRTPAGAQVERYFPSRVVQTIANPYQRARFLDTETYVIVRQEEGSEQPLFNPDDPATANVSEVCFMTPGSINKSRSASTEVTPLVMTQPLSWMWNFGEAPERIDRSASEAAPRMLAARITGKSKQFGDLNVIYVADMDCISNRFWAWRNRPVIEQLGVGLAFENFPFAMNLVDSLCDESSFINVRNRRIRHATLHTIEVATEAKWNEFEQQTEQFDTDLQKIQMKLRDDAVAESARIKSQIDKLKNKRAQGEPIDTAVLDRLENLFQQQQAEQQKKMSEQVKQKQEEFNELKRQVYLEAELEIQQIQGKYKLGAVTFPAIPPLLVGLVVFVRRRLRERAGISKARRLK